LKYPPKHKRLTSWTPELLLKLLDEPLSREVI
jgi:hypothetical protein